MLRKNLSTPALALLLSVGTSAHAQETCGELCSPEFMAYASEQQVLDAIRGVDWSLRDDGGNTLFHWMATFEYPDVITTLLASGADLNARNPLGETPLHWAAIGGYTVGIETLLAGGADLNARDHQGYTPLHSAARFGFPSNVLALLEAGADVSAVTSDGRTAYDLAGESLGMRNSGAYQALSDARFR